MKNNAYIYICIYTQQNFIKSFETEFKKEDKESSKLRLHKKHQKSITAFQSSTNKDWKFKLYLIYENFHGKFKSRNK